MNREVKFRGKRIDNGEWVYGNYNLRLDIGAQATYSNTVIEPINGYDRPQEVDPETVGQYTGLKDKNGKEIYCGDEVKTSAGNGRIEFGNGVVWLHWERKDSMPLFAYQIPNNSIEITGNVHNK